VCPFAVRRLEAHTLDELLLNYVFQIKSNYCIIHLLKSDQPFPFELL